MDNLWRQRSFTYHHRIDHRRPPFINGYEDGFYIPNHVWKAEGEWQYGDHKSPFSIITIDKSRYEKIDGEWQISKPNKEETIEARIKKVVSFGKYKMMNGYYTFKPNLLYLDPLNKENFKGIIEIDPDRLLPKSIIVTKDTVKVWEVHISGFNKKHKIKPPIKQTKRFVIEPAERDLIIRLRKRLNTFSISAKIEYSLGQLILTIPGPISIEDLKSMLSPGSGGLFKGHWEDNRFKIDSPIAAKKNIKATELKFDPLSRPLITVLLKDKVDVTGHIGLYVDDELIETKYFDKTQKLNIMDFLMLSDFRKAERVVGKLSSPDLPVIKVLEVEGQ